MDPHKADLNLCCRVHTDCQKILSSFRGSSLDLYLGVTRICHTQTEKDKNDVRIVQSLDWLFISQSRQCNVLINSQHLSSQKKKSNQLPNTFCFPIQKQFSFDSYKAIYIYFFHKKSYLTYNIDVFFFLSMHLKRSTWQWS